MILLPFQLFAAKSRLFKFFVYNVSLIAPDLFNHFLWWNTNPSEWFRDQWSLVLFLLDQGNHFRMKTISPYMEVLFSSKNGPVGPIRTVTERGPVPKTFRRVNIFTLKNARNNLVNYHGQWLPNIHIMGKNAMGRNDEKIAGLVISIHARIAMIFDVLVSDIRAFHWALNQARISPHRGPRCAQTRPLLRIGQTSRFCAKYITNRKWR